MIKITNLRFCKHYMTCFDVMYISGGELWFGKYEHAVQPDSVYLFIKDINGSPLTLRRTEALCFYDESRDTWTSQIDDNIYVEFSGFVSNTLKEMASFAIDELSGSETDISGSKSITNRIKNRFKFWFETKNRRINMINEEACLMPSLKECKRYMNCFDALFVQDHELNFGKYSTAVKEVPNIITIYSSGTIFSIPKEDALCFFDRCEHRWVMILSKHCRISWQVNTEDDDIYLRMLASIAEDELKGSRGDHNYFSITSRIKNRYRTWFEERNKCRLINSDEMAFDESVCIPQTRNNEERFKFRNGKYIRATCQPPQPKFVQFNGVYTTVVWYDGSHTVVKKAEGEEYDEEKAILFAIVKHLCKDNGCEMSRYFDKFFKNERNINKED